MAVEKLNVKPHSAPFPTTQERVKQDIIEVKPINTLLNQGAYPCIPIPIATPEWNVIEVAPKNKPLEQKSYKDLPKQKEKVYTGQAEEYANLLEALKEPNTN